MRVHELNISLDKYDHTVFLCDCGWSRRIINPQSDDKMRIGKEHIQHITAENKKDSLESFRDAYIAREERRYRDSTHT